MTVGEQLAQDGTLPLHEEWARAIEALERSAAVVAISHVNPDGDTLGAALGLAHTLRARGKRVHLACASPVDDNLRFLPGADGYSRSIPEGPWDVVVTLDSSDEGRFAPLRDAHRDVFAGRPLINVDHHLTNTLYGSINLVDPRAASTTEVVWRLARRAGWDLSPEAATCLLTGLMTDTGSFQYSNTSARALEAAADLVRAGAALEAIALHAFRRRSFTTAKLWGVVLSGLQRSPRGQVVWCTVTQAMAAEVQARIGDADGVSNWLGAIDGADLSIVFKETPDGQTQVSFRSSAQVDATVLARRLGGGGHARAAGCTVPRPLAQAVPETLALARELYGLE